MKVNGSHLQNSVNISSTKSNRSDAKADAAEGNVSAKDLQGSAKVNISEQAQLFAKGKEAATPDMNTVREDRVAELQGLIDSGKYNVDAAAVADRLVDEHMI